jgi:hypothetical protein
MAMTQRESSILLTALTAAQLLIKSEMIKVSFETHNDDERLYAHGFNKGLDIAIQKINAAKIAVCENKI